MVSGCARARAALLGRTYHEIIARAVGLAPGGHDVGIVEGNDDDAVDALCPELGLVVQVRREVGSLARRGEGAGDGDDDDLAALALFWFSCVASAEPRWPGVLPPPARKGGWTNLWRRRTFAGSRSP